MNCCVKCFKDVEIKAIIQGLNLNGNCDFCRQINTNIYQIGKDTILSDLFDGLLDVYTPANSLPDTFPKENTDLLKNILHDQWNIFNVDSNSIYRLITQICHEKYHEHPELFDNPVGILESQDIDYLNKNSIIKNYSWNDFVEAIKRKNRFHTDFINKEVLDLFVRCVRKTYKAGTTFYRGRTCRDKNGFLSTEMGAPPVTLATAGRANPEGISILYLADTVKTTLYEIRAGVYDYITVGDFELQKDIEVINLADIDKISPFIGIDFTQHAINMEHLKMICKEIAKPLRRHDSLLDYIPTQYITDYIKSKNFDGIEYISTMCQGGFNLAIFDESSFTCKQTTVYDIKDLSYTYNRIN
jgi:hypothetical protein